MTPQAKTAPDSPDASNEQDTPTPDRSPDRKATKDEIAAGEIVIPQYEQAVQRAAAANDVELLEDLHEAYHEARMDEHKDRQARAERRAKRAREGGES